jgi:predicted DNA-binding transcriptional regulator YafY
MPKTAGTDTQVMRVIQILRRLQGLERGALLLDLLKEHGISRSQIRRDLIALEEAGMPIVIEQEAGRSGRARVRLLEPDSTRVRITRRERAALLAVLRHFDVFAGTPFHQDLNTVFARLADTLPARHKIELRALAHQVVYRPTGGIKSYADKEDIIDAFQTGLMDRRLVRYSYRPRSGSPSSGTMAPYAFVFHRNGLYVVASRVHDDGKRQEPRVFAIERFDDAEPVRRTQFERPAELVIDDLFDGAFGIISGKQRHHVVVELSRAVRADALSRTWHKTQATTALPDGRVRVEFDVSSLPDVAAWVLEWGRNARAIEPAELRERVVEELQESLAQYGS